MGLPKKLTEMQMRFAELLVFGDEHGPLTQTEAALKAGYSPKRARVEASELTNPRHSPLVVKYIGELREERIKKHEVTYEGHIAELGRLREAALRKGSFSSAVKQLLTDYGQIIDVTPSTTSESSLPMPEESSSDPQK